MRYVVLYATDCPACSKVAAMVTDASLSGLEAQGFEDSEIAESLRIAGLAIPDRPSLAVMSDTDVQVLTGLAMRRHLAGVLGWRRSRTIVRLLAAEWRARLARSAASRTPAMLPVNRDDAARVLHTATAQRAIRAWGPADTQVHEISGGGSHPVFVLTHADRDIYTFIDNSPGALRENKPVGMSLGIAPTAEHALRYYTVDGAALADIHLGDGKATVSAVRSSSGQTAPDVIPDISKVQFACWAGNLGRRSTVACRYVCENCFYYAIGTPARIIACANCVICAGPNGVACAKECGII